MSNGAVGMKDGFALERKGCPIAAHSAVGRRTTCESTFLGLRATHIIALDTLGAY